jgi:hypothetical protein
MKARNWTTWERYLPSAKVETRTGAAALCLKPWDQILSEEGVEERMAIKEPLWRSWEKYLPVDADAMALQLSEERPEKVKV